MREIKFRGKRVNNGEWVYGYYLKSASTFIAVDDGLVDGHFDLYEVDPATVGQYTGLRDKNGREIWEGDRLRFFSNKNCIWEGTVIFEDGVFTVSILDAKQVKNPDDWDKKHNWIDSRYWSITVGYGECGTADCPRRPLTEMKTMFDDYKQQLKPLYEKYGWVNGLSGFGSRIINVEVIGNIWDNPELLEVEEKCVR